MVKDMLKHMKIERPHVSPHASANKVDKGADTYASAYVMWGVREYS